MRIKDVRPGDRPSRRGFVCLARFNIEPIEGVVVYDLTVERAPDGREFVYSPMRTGGPVANFSPHVRQRLIAMAKDALEDVSKPFAA
ncbi:hypothetical protein [Phreatobacter sp. AB_2022a]|uniref:hypothetical protein n=1 Tax=Phreatobacter sp. AB_2022a TaxID=3003134 RepID=UPI002286E86C|nr:hypothetical protein [Phreatobacter sp. AB_2022a]MCZ0734584.1 hypothetical protein [Phreatobacter sp. AB_2022a]